MITHTPTVVRESPGLHGRRRRFAAGLPLAGAVAAAVLLPGQAAHAAPGAGQDLTSRVERSVVQLRVEWEGYLYYESVDGYVWTQQPVQAAALCSGFFVSGSGDLVTAGHCVDPAQGRSAIIEAFLDDAVEDGSLTSAAAADLVSSADANWKVAGASQGSPVSRAVSVSQPQAVEGVVVTDPLPARVVDLKPFTEGDVALLHVELSDTPPLAIADADPAGGDPITLVGFPASVSDVTVDAAKVRPSFKTGTVSSRQITDNGVAETEVNADIGGGMSGGPAINPQGAVLGVNSSSLQGEDQNFNFITDTTDLGDWLAAKGMHVTAAQAPAAALPSTRPHSGGLPGARWLLFGIPLLGALTAVAVLLIVRSRRHTTIAYDHAAPAGPSPEAVHSGCASCGRKLGPETAFCGRCGAPAGSLLP